MRVMFCTTPVDEAENITNILLEEQLVACVNIIPKVESHYIWEGKICHDKESLLIIKTKKELIPKLIKRINDIHSYETVEIITFEIKEGDSNYLNWIASVTK